MPSGSRFSAVRAHWASSRTTPGMGTPNSSSTSPGRGMGAGGMGWAGSGTHNQRRAMLAHPPREGIVGPERGTRCNSRFQFPTAHGELAKPSGKSAIPFGTVHGPPARALGEHSTVDHSAQVISSPAAGSLNRQNHCRGISAPGSTAKSHVRPAAETVETSST